MHITYHKGIDIFHLRYCDTMNGKLGLVYCIAVQTITINLSKMEEPVIER